MMQRRHLLRSAAALLTAVPLTGALRADTPAIAATSAATLLSKSRELVPLVVSPDRIIEMNVCTRPFRAQGPRIEKERIGRKQVVHNYGHGGSGGSMSWGSVLFATQIAQATGQQQIAIVGCGAIG
jgi:hypothetical protein